MGIKVNSGFTVGAPVPIDERTVLTKDQMHNMLDASMPDNYFAVCSDDGNLYVYDKSREPNAETGRFRLVTGGEGHTHENQDVLDSITEEKINEIHTHENQDVLDSITEEKINEIHTHENQDVLDSITEEKINEIHTHENQDVLDSITEEKLNEWDTAAEAIGDTDTLQTEAKTIVEAINEVLEKAEDNSSGSGQAEDIEYENADYPDFNNVDLALDALFAKVYYVKPSCSLSASPVGGTFEMGTVISAPIAFTWTTNKTINTQTLTDCTLADETVRTATYESDISVDKTFTLTVSDGENTATSSVSYKFMNNVFWGSAPVADIYDSAFIDSLSNKKLVTSIKGTYAFNIAAGEYGFWAVPSNMVLSTVWIGGFEVTVEDLGTVSYTNAQGYTRDYTLYKTGQSGLGSISAEIK